MDFEKDLMSFPYDVCWAKPEQWKPAMLMVWKTFMKFEAPDYTSEGIRHFFEFITDDDIHNAFLGGRYPVLLAMDGTEIVGVASLRNDNHLSLLFVDENYHHKGIGRMLIELLCDYIGRELGEQYMTVRAAPYAVEFYKKCGFHAVREELELGGIRITPMERSVSHEIS